MNENSEETELSYPEVLEYLSDRVGDWVSVSSYPSFSTGEGEGGPTLLGLTLTGLTLAKVDAVKPHEEQWLDGRAGTRIHLTALEEWAHLPDDGLVLTREWFGGARLDDTHSVLRISVRANPDAEPFYPAVGEESSEERGEVFMHDLVGWGFVFDFDGSAPFSGRWALEQGD